MPALRAQQRSGRAAGRLASAETSPREDRPAPAHGHREPDFPRLRVVLKGALYRSGSPSEDGLLQVCREGWKRVYSLYGERTTSHGPRNEAMIESGKDQRQCEVAPGKQRTLEWLAATSNKQHSIPQILHDVRETIRDPAQGPVLVHCWNGLHYAGMVSALALRQFCGLSASEAEAYWRSTANRGANYPELIQHIHDFRPVPGLSLSPAEKKRVCPDLGLARK